MSSVLVADGRFLLVLNGGYRPPSISVLDTKDGHEIGRTPVADAWLGLALSPNGRTLWVGGGSRAAIYEFSFDENGSLQPTRTFDMVKTCRPDLSRFHRRRRRLARWTHLLYACDLYHDTILVVNPQSGMVIDRFKTGRRPYRILFHPDGKSFFVTSWADGAMYHHQTSNGAATADGSHRRASHRYGLARRRRRFRRWRRGQAGRRAFLSRPRTPIMFMPWRFPTAAICSVVETINVWHDSAAIRSA